MIGGGNWIKVPHFQILTNTAYRLITGEPLGDWLLVRCHCAAYGAIEDDPAVWHLLFGGQKRTASKRMGKIRHFLSSYQELTPEQRKKAEIFVPELSSNPKLLVMPDLLDDLAEYANRCNQASRSGKRGAEARWGIQEMATAMAPDGEAEAESEEDDRGRKHISLPSGGGRVEDVDFVSHAPKRRASGPVDAERIADDLGEHMQTFGTLAALFGASVRPAVDAPKVADLLNTGKVTAEALIKAAKARRAQVSAPRFMGSLSRWLDEGGYLVQPDPNATSATSSKAPSHRQAAEEASRGQWADYLKRTGTKP